VVGGDADWAREIRRQLILEIELVGGGLADGGRLPHQDTPAEANERMDDLRSRLEQVERLIEAIVALRNDIEENSRYPVMPDNAAIDGRNACSDRSGSLAD
jgi:hypothetical protein